MSKLSQTSSVRNPSPCLDAIDAAAEREAEALAWLAEQLGVPEAVDPVGVERERRRIARERGLPAPPVYRYNRGQAISRWLEIVDAINAGKPARQTKNDLYTTSRRKRFAVDRAALVARQRALLAALEKSPDGTLVDKPISLRLTGLAARCLERDTLKGRVRPIVAMRPGRNGGKPHPIFVYDVKDLKALLADRIANPRGPVKTHGQREAAGRFARR